MGNQILKFEYPTRLLDALKVHLDEEILDNIAGADSGLGETENRLIIDQILKTNKVPYPLKFKPLEAFQMIMWWNPESDLNQGWPTAQIHMNHVSRAFCCACLLSNTPSDFVIDPMDILPRLIQSLIEIDYALLLPAREMICCSAMNHDSKTETDLQYDNMLCRLALILIDAHPGSDLRSKNELQEDCKQLIEDELSFREAEEVRSLVNEYSLTNYTNWEMWLLGMTLHNRSITVWKELSKTVLHNPRIDLSDTDRIASIEIADKILNF